jgi:hypothetical protein
MGDRVEVELELEQSLRLEAVDAQNLDMVARVRGPLAYFGMGEIPDGITRPRLPAATPVGSAGDLMVKLENDEMHMRPFPSITDETYRLYFKATKQTKGASR